MQILYKAVDLLCCSVAAVQLVPCSPQLQGSGGDRNAFRVRGRGVMRTCTAGTLATGAGEESQPFYTSFKMKQGESC